MDANTILQQLAALSPEEQAKVAGAVNASATPWYKDPVQREVIFKKLGAEGFAKLAEETAAYEEFQKVAADYDAAGRIMARSFVDELFKLGAAQQAQAPSKDSVLESILGK